MKKVIRVFAALIAIAALIGVFQVHAGNQDQAPMSVTVHTTNTLILPAINPLTYRMYSTNSTYTNGTYISANVQIVDDATGSTNYQQRFFWVVTGGTNAAYTAATLNVTNDITDGDCVFRPIVKDVKSRAIINDSAGILYLGFGTGAIVNKGYRLNSNGSTYVTQGGLSSGQGLDTWLGEVWGISTANDCNIGTQEIRNNYR